MSLPSFAGPGRLAFLLALLLCLACAGPVLAAATPPALFGRLGFYDFVADRSRIIQVSIVCVIIGICLLYKK